MADITLQATEKSRVEAVSEKVSRLFFIDHLRAALVILVVLHHVAVVYVGIIPFYYVEIPKAPTLGGLALFLFTLFNQAWFMGALFLIAGYFTPGSFDRKGSGSFLKNRLLRLGIPLIIFMFVISPIAATGYWQMPAAMTGITAPLTWQAYPYLIDLGIAWFLALLLVFSFGYVGWRMLTRNRPPAAAGESSSPSYLGVGIFILALALLSYLIRFIIPIGNEVLGFPTLAYLPQYLALFIAGTVAYRRNWFRTIPGSMGAVGFAAALLATILLFPYAFSGALFSLEFSEAFVNATGNGNVQSAAYALWDSIFAIGMCLAALTFFRRFLNRDAAFGGFLSQQSYAVYVIHAPIVVYVAIAMRGIDLGPFLKFAVAAIIAVPTCFVVAWAIRKIPGVSRVL
jgi:glucan biosynthesis protein C